MAAQSGDRDLFAAVLRAATDYSIIGTDAEGMITLFNEGAERMLGYRASEMIGRATPVIIHDPTEIAERAVELGVAPGFDVFVAAARRGESETRVWTYVRKDGSRLRVSLTVTAMHSDSGLLTGFIGVARDITALDEAIAERERLAHQNELVLNSAGEGICGINRIGMITFANPAAAAMLGYEADDLIGKHFYDVAQHDEAGSASWGDSSIAAAIKDGAVHHVAGEVFRRKDGQNFPVEYVVAAIRERGQISGAVVAFNDITRRKRAEEERAQLLAREQKARADAEAAIELIRRLQSVTDAALAHLSLEDLLQELLTRIGDILAVDTVVTLLIEEDGCLVTRAAKGLGEDVASRIRIPIGQGFAGRVAAERRPIIVEGTDQTDLLNPRLREKGIKSLLGVPLLVEGQVTGVLHVGTIRSRRFSAEDVRLLQLVADRVAMAVDRARLYEAEREALSAAESLAAERAAILGQIADGVIIVAPDGRVVFVNAAARHLLGFAEHGRSTVSGRGPDYQIAVDGEPQTVVELALAKAALRGETVLREEFQVERPGNVKLALEGSAAPVVGTDGALLGAVLTLRDVTAQRDLERQKDEFITNVSHELKTPLTGIKASVGVVLANEPPSTPEPLHRMLVNIDLAADRLIKIVNDLLDMSRLQAGRIQLRPQICDVRQLAARAAQAIEPIAQTRGQQLILDLPADAVPAVVDAERIEQALLNLLSNANKYGRQGGVIRLHLEWNEDEVRLAVSDDGPGIPEHEQKRIFDRFYRSESDATYHTQGNGLGLPIARAMVELHGGRIWVESSPGAGATFWIALPSKSYTMTLAKEGIP